MRYLYRIFFLWTVSLFGQLNVEVSARTAILMNAETGAILYEKDAHVPRYPASTTKIATALYALEQKKPQLDQMVSVSAEALRIKPKDKAGVPSYWDEVDGTKMGLIRGEILPLESLFYGLMRMSGNDASNVIAENLSSSIPAYITEMNSYVLDLGCKNTKFCNPHGLHDDNHYTTAFDMCLITQKALQIPQFRHMVSRSFYQKPQTNKQPSNEIQPRNALLKDGKYFYPKALGVKTGYHSKSMYNLVAAAEHEGRELIAVLFGCEKSVDRYKDAIRLFDVAFAEEKTERVFFKPTHLFHYTIDGAKTPLAAVLQEDVAISYFPSEEPTCRAFIHWELPKLPITKGQKVGEVRISDAKGTIVRTGDLFAQEDVKPTFGHVVKSNFARLFK